jgi:hypothetical protein
MELLLSDHMRGLDPSQGRLGRMEGLEAKHGARNPLYEAMIFEVPLVSETPASFIFCCFIS